MTQEDKELLLQDLCARLPYVVYARTINEFGESYTNRISPDNINLVFSGWFKECKPYLRPMSSVTKDERDYLNGLEEMGLPTYDFYNEHHLDYRGLIEAGLALEAPKGMYKTE